MMQRIYCKTLEGIPHGTTLPCCLCGDVSPLTYQVDDALWDKIAPRFSKRAVICLPCFDVLCEKNGIDITEHLKSIYLISIDGSKTIELSIEKVYYWHREEPK